MSTINRHTLNDTAITRDFHERIVTINDTNDVAEVNKLPVANQYGYLDNSWLKDYSGYKIEPKGDLTEDFVAEKREYVNVITLKAPNLKICLSGDFIIEDVPYTRAIVYRFLIFNPDNYLLDWVSDVNDYSIIWNTYSETAPTLDANGTYIEFISIDRGKTWYGVATDKDVNFDIVNGYYTKTESDNRFVNATGDTITGKLTLSGTHTSNNTRAILITGDNNSYAIGIQNTDHIKGTTPVENRINGGIDFYGQDMSSPDNKIATFYNSVNTDNENAVTMEVYNLSASDNTERNYISVSIAPDGTKSTYAFTPDTDDNSNNIATTAYVKSQNLVPAMNNSTKFMCLTNNGTTSEWVRYNKNYYISYPTEDITSLVIPSQYLEDSIITEVYRNGVLLTTPDDYSIIETTDNNATTTTISFTDTIYRNEKIIVIFNNAVKLHSNEVLDSVTIINSTATTPDFTDNSNRIATTAFVNYVLSNSSGGSSSGSSSGAVLYSPTLTGTPRTTDAAVGTDNDQIANTRFVNAAIENALDSYAPLNSPAFTGTPTIETSPNTNDNSNKIATTEYVQGNISALVDGATLDTLKKLSDAINGDANFSTTVNTALDGKLNINIAITGDGNAITSISDSNGNVTAVKGETFSLSTHNHDSEYLAKLDSVGSGINPVYTDGSGILTASLATVGSADTPVYLNSGIITSTDKNFSDYLLLTGGTITGELVVSDSISIGDTTNKHIVISESSIQAKSDDSTSDDLYINSDGGDIHFGDVNNRVTISDGVITASSFVGNIGGISDKAEKDSEGNVITETYAKLDSPDFIGSPTAPTASEGDNSTQIATTEFVSTAIANLINSAPEDLNTLKELADVLTDEDSGIAAINSALSSKLNSNIAVTGDGNAITDISDSDGNVTAIKGETFSLSTHNHDEDYLAKVTLQGSETKGIYVDSNGNIQEMLYSVNTDVPADAVFTDTTYTQGTGITISGTTISANDQLPSQTNNSGKFLTTNGTTVSWANVNVNALPDQTNNSGKILTTDGSVASWSDPINETRISSIHYPNTGDTTIVLTEQQSVPSNLNKYSLSVYRDGLYLNPDVDYGFNHSTNTFTFAKAFEVDEIVIIIFTYLNTESQTVIDIDVDEYEAGSNITFTDNAISGKVIINATDTITTIDSNITGDGNAITDISASNGVISITKGNTFSLSNHNHDSIYAKINSQEFTGTPTIQSSPNTTDNSTKISTTEYVNNRFGVAIEKVSNVTSSNNITIDPTQGSMFNLTLNTDASISISSISNGYYTNNGACITLFIPVTNYVVYWNNNINWAGGSAPNLSNGYNILTLVSSDDGTTWYGNAISVS